MRITESLMIMSEIIADDAACIEGLEACFFDDDFVQGELLRGKESTGQYTYERQRSRD